LDTAVTNLSHVASQFQILWRLFLRSWSSRISLQAVLKSLYQNWNLHRRHMRQS